MKESATYEQWLYLYFIDAFILVNLLLTVVLRVLHGDFNFLTNFTDMNMCVCVRAIYL